MAKPENVTTWESFRAINPSDLEQPEGRYDAFETRHDECGVWSPKTEATFETKSFADDAKASPYRRFAGSMTDHAKRISDLRNRKQVTTMKLHDVVRTKNDIKNTGGTVVVRAGTRGTIVYEYMNHDAVEVEFVAERITAYAKRSDLLPV
jgi:hypothetical protein